MKSKVAVASRSFSKHPVLRNELLRRYQNVTFNETGRTLSGEDLIKFLKGHDKAIIALEKIDDDILSQLPELRIISKYGVGLDSIDLDAMERRGVLLGWKGGVNRRSVAELTLSSMIALLHMLPFAMDEVSSGRWYQVKGRELTGKTVGIIGCGNIGKELVLLLKPFRCKILSYDIRNFSKFYSEHNIQPVSLEELLTRSDIVTIHLPLTGSTRNILDEKRLEMMKKGSIFINFARGGLVDESKLKELIKKGHIAGAATDVFYNEPPDDPEFFKLPNVIVTPHIGGSTEEAIIEMGMAAIEGLENAQRVDETVPFYMR